MAASIPTLAYLSASVGSDGEREQSQCEEKALTHKTAHCSSY